MSPARMGADAEAVDDLDGGRRGCAGHLAGSLGPQWKRRGRILGARAWKRRRCCGSTGAKEQARVRHEGWAKGECFRTRRRAGVSGVRPGALASKTQKCSKAISGREACGFIQAEECLHVSGQHRAGCPSEEAFV